MLKSKFMYHFINENGFLCAQPHHQIRDLCRFPNNHGIILLTPIYPKNFNQGLFTQRSEQTRGLIKREIGSGLWSRGQRLGVKEEWQKVNCVIVASRGWE